MGKREKIFLNTAAICSFTGALTTALLLFLPNPETTDFESGIRLYQDKLYLSKLWILFLHPQVNMIAMTGIAYLLLRKYPAQIIIGTFFLAIWAYTEMSQQSLLIDALNQIWRPGFTQAQDENSKNIFTSLIQAANGLSDSKYFLLIYGFGLGTALYGLAFLQETGWVKYLGMAMIFIGLLSLASFSRYYLGINAIDGVVNWIYQCIYPILQPLVRIATGIWILKNGKS